MIRKALPADWTAIRNICCQTASAGEPIEQDRWVFFGEFWVGPYQKLIPEWTYVAMDASDTTTTPQVLAYLTGCPVTSSFETKKFWCFQLPLIFRLLFTREFITNLDTKKALRRMLYIDPSPELAFSASTRRILAEQYPAHLHVNALTQARGKGLGRKLIDTYQTDLSARGISGIHLFCGQAPVAFYEKCGFTILEQIHFGLKKIPIFAMGRIHKSH